MQTTINLKKFINPLRIVIHLWNYHYIIRQLTIKEVIGRYRGSFLGLGWSIINPLLMLCVYTLVFSVIFKAKWGMSPGGGKVMFALILFMGLIVFGIFAEMVNAAPSLMLANINFIKKVVFPLEILPVVKLFSTLINALLNFIVLLLGVIIVQHNVPWTILLLPVVLLPMILFALGCSYFLASLGVFIRDIESFVNILVTVLFFLSPIFYPIEAVPENLRIFCQMNPIGIFVENARMVVLWGMLPDWIIYFLSLVFSLLILILGFLWFMKSKKAFADVI